MSDAAKFGRVDDQNNVYVIESGAERRVGQFPGVKADEAMAYFVRKFEDLEAQVRLLEQRIKGATSDPKVVAKSITSIEKELVEPAVVGDIDNLRSRVANAKPGLDKLHEEQKQANEKAVADTLAMKEKIAAKAEKLSQRDTAKTIWKTASVEMNQLFEQWQTLQKTGPRVPKSIADPIWKRFSQARAKFESNKRAFFADMDKKVKAAKSVKQELVQQAEALVSKGPEAATDYRKLLDEWKKHPRTGKQEDELWARLRAAGDTIFEAKKAEEQKTRAEESENLAKKMELIAEAEKIDTNDLDSARSKLAKISSQWESAGRVPREKVRELEDRIRTVERKIKKTEEDQWRKSDPAAKERSSSLIDQLEDSIAEIAAEIKTESDAKKKAELEKNLAARQSWLDAARGASN